MHSLFRLFIDILLRRKGPQDLPSSWSFGLVVVLCGLLANAAYVAMAVPDGRWLVRTVADFAASAGFLALVLVLGGHPRRFQQSFTALCGVGLLLTLPAYGFVLLAQTGWSPLQWLLDLLFTMLLVASLFVTEHILRQALECSPWRSVPLTFANLMLSIAVSQWFNLPAAAA